MKLDVQTLAFVLSLTIMAQVVAIYIQHRVNRTYRGIGWWLLGSALMALGFIALSLGSLNYVWVLSKAANPMLVLGRICLLIGILRFQDKRENRWVIGAIFAVFLTSYYYFLFGQADISARTVVVSAAVAIYSWMIAYNLLAQVPKTYSGSAAFTGVVFLAHGLWLAVIIGDTLRSGHIRSFREYDPIQVSAFLVPTLTSTLWTFGFILMVNQRLNAENLEEKENLRQVFNTSPDAALIVRLEDGLIIDANAGFFEMSRQPRSEVIGFGVRDLRFWSDTADMDRFMARIRRDKHCENLESTYRRRDGVLLVGLTSARVLTIDDQPHIVSVTRDITEQKRAAEALKESEETYRSILRASPDDITITDLEGRILMVSPAAYRMFGYEPGEEAGRHLLEFIVPEDQERGRANILSMYHGGHQKPNEYTGIRKDGSRVHIEVNSGLIHGLHGQPVKMVFVVREITERRKAETAKEELASKMRQLQKAESLGRMAGAVAHHFNNQLQSVLGNLELLTEFPGGARASRWVDGARQAAERAAEVSRHMLVYLGQASMDQQPGFLSELCRGSLPIIQGTLPEIVAIEAEFPTPGPLVCVNPTQIQQVLTHLLTNAWEALGSTREGIRLKLGTCGAMDIPGIYRFPIDWVPKEPEYAYLEVSDAGCGIAEADIEKLFDPFFTTKFSGRGLGLSLVLGIVQAHGGVLTVESTLGSGSVFRIHFPVCTRSTPVAPHSRNQSLVSGAPGGTILLVDDDELLLQSTGAIIVILGYSLLTARDGEEALAIFRQHRHEIRCVITDLTMPRMDGWQTLAALREIEPALPVILTSGYDKLRVLSGAHAQQPVAFLGKPFNLRTLREALSQALATVQVLP